MYFNVPKGFEEIANALEDDAPLRDTLLQPRASMFFFAGAGLSQPVWDKLDRMAEADLRRAHPHAHRPGHDRDRAVRDVRQRARR